MSRQEIDKKFDEIVDFAEMEEFIDTPVKRYSSGMQVKLAFAVATSIDSEILIVDEVLAVGDLAFQRKCFDRMESMIKRQGKTVLVVSHNIRQIQRLSSRVILLNHGAIVADEMPEPVCNKFYEFSDKQISETRGRNGEKKSQSSGDVELLSIEILDRNECVTDFVTHNVDATFRLKLLVKNKLSQPVISLGIHTVDFLYLGTTGFYLPSDLEVGNHEIICKINRFPFLPRSYSLRVGLNVGKNLVPVFYGENLKSFLVKDPSINRVDAGEGFVDISSSWFVTD